MSGFSWRRGGRFLAATLPAALVVVTCGQGKLRGGEAVGSNPSPLATNAAALEYQDAAYTVNNVGVSVTPQPHAFTKEPAALSGQIVRGVLNFGGAGNALPFLWQRDAGKLYLDLNRNRDLTDDADGTLLARLARPIYYQVFTNAHFVLATPSGRCPVVADISFWNYGAQPSCSVALRSFWQGKLTLAGQDWQVGVVPNLLQPADSFAGSQMLLRPWARRNQPFTAAGNSFDAVPFSQKIFIGGHAWQVHSLGGSPAGDFKPTLQFVEQSVPLGELKITGQFIRRVILPGGAYLVVLDQPATTVKVPVGNYSSPNVLLEQGGVEAYCSAMQWQSGRRISVDENTPGILAAGGPLTNTAAITRHGQDLRMDYRLVGAGGQAYQLANPDRSHPPQFAIFKGGKKIASGNFEFG